MGGGLGTGRVRSGLARLGSSRLARPSGWRWSRWASVHAMIGCVILAVTRLLTRARAGRFRWLTDGLLLATGMLVCLSACASSTALRSRTAVSQPRCSLAQSFDGKQCRPFEDATAELRQTLRMLAEVEIERALSELERLRQGGPFRYRTQLEIYRQLALAHAYLDQPQAAVGAFGSLLALDPAHVIRYTLSPKVTFLFEQARRQSRQRPQTALRVVWPRDTRVDEAIAIEAEVVADPVRLLRRARVHFRLKGGSWQHVDVRLKPIGSFARVLLPAVAAGKTQSCTLEMHLVAYDSAGNETLLWREAERPLRLTLRYEQPMPWYRKWWIWALGGVVAASAAGTAAYAATRNPPATTEGRFAVQP
jgi:hypothetical protein